jgi:hypothetical protein
VDDLELNRVTYHNLKRTNQEDLKANLGVITDVELSADMAQQAIPSYLTVQTRQLSG